MSRRRGLNGACSPAVWEASSPEGSRISKTTKSECRHRRGPKSKEKAAFQRCTVLVTLLVPISSGSVSVQKPHAIAAPKRLRSHSADWCDADPTAYAPLVPRQTDPFSATLPLFSSRHAGGTSAEYGCLDRAAAAPRGWNHNLFLKSTIIIIHQSLIQKL